jgi:K+-sensing histidine kinase KdpD
MGIQSCSIVALDLESGQFRARASRGLSEGYAELINIDPAEPHSITMQAIHSGDPQQISDTEQDANYATQLFRSRSEGYRSILAVPLNTQHTPPAALLVYKPEPHIFSEQEIGLLMSFANHAAMAIENAELFARSDTRLKEQTRRLEALIQSFQDGLLLEDLHGHILYANRSISEMLAIPIQDIIDMPIENLVERILTLADSSDPDQRSRTRQEVLAAIKGERHNQVEISILSGHKKRHLLLQVFNVTDPDDHLIGRGQILSDVTHSQEIDRMRTSLISTVSHELRTPLAAIKGYVTTLLANDVEWDKGTQREFLEIIQSETDRLSDLVSDLLDMSRIEAGNLVVNRVECNLKDLIILAANRAHPRPEGQLEISLPEDIPLLYVDPQRIGAVLRNLIENATKYSGEHTSIQVSATIHNSNVIVRVLDEGPGIPVEHSERIFDSFYQVNEGLPRQSSGAGLGLSICRGFVKAHGGDIWLEPCPSGTCIAFSLPLDPSKDLRSTTDHFV